MEPSPILRGSSDSTRRGRSIRDLTTADGCRLAVDDPGGTGRPLILLHAWGLHSGMWQPLIPRLTQAGFRPITIDRRGHGASDRPHSGYDLDTLVGDVTDLIDQLGLDDISLLGHSFGALEAAALTARDPEGRVSCLVLSATTTPCLQASETNPTGIPPEFLEAARGQISHDVGQWIVDNTAGYWGGGEMGRPVEHVWTQQALFDTPVRVLLALHETMSGADVRADLASIRVPTLVIHGSDDRSSPLDFTGRPTAELLPNGRLEVIDGAGHGLYASYHELYLQAIIEHLAAQSVEPAR